MDQKLNRLPAYSCNNNFQSSLNLFSCKCILHIEAATIEAATEGVLWKKVFLKISQNSQENTCARVSFLVKLQS